MEEGLKKHKEDRKLFLNHAVQQDIGLALDKMVQLNDIVTVKKIENITKLFTFLKSHLSSTGVCVNQKELHGCLEKLDFHASLGCLIVRKFCQLERNSEKVLQGKVLIPSIKYLFQCSVFSTEEIFAQLLDLDTPKSRRVKQLLSSSNQGAAKSFMDSGLVKLIGDLDFLEKSVTSFKLDDLTTFKGEVIDILGDVLNECKRSGKFVDSITRLFTTAKDNFLQKDAMNFEAVFGDKESYSKESVVFRVVLTMLSGKLGEGFHDGEIRRKFLSFLQSNYPSISSQIHNVSGIGLDALMGQLHDLEDRPKLRRDARFLKGLFFKMTLFLQAFILAKLESVQYRKSHKSVQIRLPMLNTIFETQPKSPYYSVAERGKMTAKIITKLISQLSSPTDNARLQDIATDFTLIQIRLREHNEKTTAAFGPSCETNDLDAFTGKKVKKGMPPSRIKKFVDGSDSDQKYVADEDILKSLRQETILKHKAESKHQVIQEKLEQDFQQVIYNPSGLDEECLKLSAMHILDQIYKTNPDLLEKIEGVRATLKPLKGQQSIATLAQELEGFCQENSISIRVVRLSMQSKGKLQIEKSTAATIGLGKPSPDFTIYQYEAHFYVGYGKKGGGAS